MLLGEHYELYATPLAADTTAIVYLVERDLLTAGRADRLASLRRAIHPWVATWRGEWDGAPEDGLGARPLGAGAPGVGSRGAATPLGRGGARPLESPEGIG